MPRRPRLFLPGITQHVVHRGVNRGVVFRAPSDHAVFLNLLQFAALAGGVAVHAYALMSNHIHIMATPQSERSLSLMMQDVGRAYARFFNRRYARTGTMWEGRFHSTLLMNESYWMTCLRYVELNPVRAGLAAHPEEYRWSSYRAHAFGEPNPLVGSHPLFDALGATAPERQAAWRNICRAPMSEERLVEFREALRSGTGSGRDPDTDLAPIRIPF